MSGPLVKLARQRQTELDELIARWRQGPGVGVRLWCGPECGNCCTLAVNTTYPEALALAATLTTQQQERVATSAASIIAHASQSLDARSFLSGYRQAVGPARSSMIPGTAASTRSAPSPAGPAVDPPPGGVA